MSSAALVALFLLGEASGPSVSEKVEYYGVSGATAVELRASINRHRPGGEKSLFGDGRTTWYVSWQYQSAKRDQCSIATVHTAVEIKKTLPRWSPSPSASPELVGRWDRYILALKAHEKGHAEIGLDAARAIEKRFGELGSFPDCQLLDAAIKKAGEEVLSQFSKKDLGYDLRTVHGLTQGATFP